VVRQTRRLSIAACAGIDAEEGSAEVAARPPSGYDVLAMTGPRDREVEPTLAADAAVGGGRSGAPPHPAVVAGRYEIVALLGIGGMGRVYRALDRELGEPVALKMLHAGLVASDDMVERFRQEVRLARRVTHRNVARTFDIGEHEGDKYLTMELVVGESLARCLERGILPLVETLRVAAEIVAGMKAAHAVGVVHRDLKPDNVLLEESGRVVITDFGIARADQPGATHHTRGQTVGTPAYMAPEQVGGAVALDGRADIYAFGAILFEMLTGRCAWPGTAAFAVAAARLLEPPPDPSAFRPGLSPALSALVLRCLARERDERYATAADLERALGSVQDREAATPIPAPRAARSEPRERTVALVPFRNLGPSDDAAFVEGLTEDLVDALATVRGLRVRGRAYAEASDRDVVDTGRRLGVDVVVEGSVRRASQNLRVSARVIGVADGFQLWSSRFDRPLGDALLLNDEVARAIAGALSTQRAEEAAGRAHVTSPEAIDLFFRAREAAVRFWSADAHAEARRLFSEALALAPDDATILSGYVNAHVGRNLFVPLPREEALPLVRRALVAAPHLADPWVALAALRFNHEGNPAGAVRALKRAMTLAPGCADAHDLLGRILLEAGEIDDARAHLERTLWLDPRQRWARIDLMRLAALEGDFARASQFYDEGPGPEWLVHRVGHKARLWSWPGAPAVEKLEPPPEMAKQFQALLVMFERARAAARGEDPVGAAELVGPFPSLAAQGQPRGRRFVRQLMAEALMVAGHRSEALLEIEAAATDGLLDRPWITRARLFDPLRGEPRFEAAAAQVIERGAQVSAAWQGPEERLDEALATLPE